jgi:DNA polymerase I-like protein with 3'-5' exonuclease and polymerase domains
MTSETFKINLGTVSLDELDKIPDHGNPASPIWVVFPTADQKALEYKSIFKSSYESWVASALDEAGLHKGDYYVCSAVEEPVANYIHYNRFRLSNKQAEDFAKRVRAHKPHLVILVGEASLQAFTGQSGIDKWRGSFLYSQLLDTEVLPIYNGFRISGEQEFRFLTQMDLNKIKIRGVRYQEPKRRYIIDPSFRECVDYLEWLGDTEGERGQEQKIFTTDIETTGLHKTAQLSCIGFSDAPYSAFVIPFLDNAKQDRHRWSHAQDVHLYKLLNRAMSNEKTIKVYQNAMFDMTFLYDRCKIMCRGRTWDTMVMHHLLYPDFKKNLGLLTSLYTLDPYYKDEGKIWSNASISDEQFWTYNAKDADVTLRIYNELIRRLKAHGAYNKAFHLSTLHTVIFEASLRGLPVDVELRNRLAKEMRIEQEGVREQIKTVVGWDINPGSSTQVKRFLYDEMEVPEKLDRKTKSVTANEVALRDIKKETQGKAATERNKTIITFIDKLLDYRDIDKLCGTYYECEISEDGRYRTTITLAGPDTGRFASSKFFDGTGNNAQNLPKRAKKFIIPGASDEVLVNADLSQAEARVVAYESQDQGLINLFLSGLDYHSANAMNIWGYKSVYDVPDDKRYLAKRGGHACNYVISDYGLAISLGIPLQVAKEFRRQYFATYPGLVAWQRSIEAKVRADRTLTTPMGRKRVYLGRVDDTLVRSATAFIPQSTVADRLNESLLSFLKVWPSAKLLLQCHDSLLFTVPKHTVDSFILTLKHHMEQPIVSKGRSYTIPADFEVGYNYGALIRYLTPEQENEVKAFIKNGSTTPEISMALRLNKDAVEHVRKGETWR